MIRRLVSTLTLLTLACGSDGGTPPGTPTGLEGVGYDGFVQLTWDASSEPEVVTYGIHHGTSPDALSELVLVDVPSLSQQITGLENETTYYFAIDARDAAGRVSDRSLAIPVTPSAAPRPFELIAIPGDHSVTLYWSGEPLVESPEPPMDGVGSSSSGLMQAIRYHVAWGTDPEALTETRTIDAPTTRLTVEDLAVNTSYYFEVTAADSLGQVTTAPAEAVATVVEIDTDPPSIVETTPTDADASVDPDSLVAVTFDEPMSPSTVSLTFDPPVALGMANWNPDGTEVVLAPTGALVEGRAYTVTVAGRDEHGNELTGDTTFAFETVFREVAPSLRTTSPTDGATEVPTNARISVGFSRAMNEVSAQRNLNVSPDTACTFEWNEASTMLTCTPMTDLVPDTTYTVTVGASATDAAGTPLGTAVSSEFATSAVVDTSPPLVVATTPEEASAGAFRGTAITITFNERMDQAWAQAAFRTEDPADRSGYFTWSADGRSMTFTSFTPYEYGHHVRYRIVSQAKDLAGNELGADYVGTFQVRRYREQLVRLWPDHLTGAVLTNGHVSTEIARCRVARFLPPSGEWASIRDFVTFYLPLPESTLEILGADLRILQLSDGDPESYANLGPVFVESVSHGTQVDLSDFDTPVHEVEECPGGGSCVTLPFQRVLSNTWGSKWIFRDVTPAVRRDWEHRVAQNRLSQFRFRWELDSSVDFEARADFVCSNPNAFALSDYGTALIIHYTTP